MIYSFFIISDFCIYMPFISIFKILFIMLNFSKFGCSLNFFYFSLCARVILKTHFRNEVYLFSY